MHTHLAKPHAHAHLHTLRARVWLCGMRILYACACFHSYTRTYVPNIVEEGFSCARTHVCVALVLPGYCGVQTRQRAAGEIQGCLHRLLGCTETRRRCCQQASAASEAATSAGWGKLLGPEADVLVSWQCLARNHTHLVARLVARVLHLSH